MFTLKKKQINSDNQQTVVNYLSFIFICFFISFFILSLISFINFELFPSVILPITLIFFDALFLALLYNAPLLIKFSTQKLEIIYLLKKRKQIRWDEINCILDPIFYICGNCMLKIIYRIDFFEKHVIVPKTKKISRILETFSKLNVIDQYQYKSIKESEYKNQFKKK